MEKTYRLYIDGKWCRAGDGGSIGVKNPATGRVFAQMAYGSRADAK